MPVDEVQACLEPRSERPTTRRHYFSASTWVLDAIDAYYGPGGESMTNEISEGGVESLQANKSAQHRHAQARRRPRRRASRTRPCPATRCCRSV